MGLDIDPNVSYIAVQTIHECIREVAMTYAEKLLDPRWQKMRLRILERDGFTCQMCCDDTMTLHVHHRRYHHGKDPWEYATDDLVTLCEQCHTAETEASRMAGQRLFNAMIAGGMWAWEFEIVAQALAGQTLQPDPISYRSASSVIIRWALTDRDATKKIRAMYARDLKRQAKIRHEKGEPF